MCIAAVEGECLIGYSITWSAPPSSVSGKGEAEPEKLLALADEVIP